MEDFPLAIGVAMPCQRCYEIIAIGDFVQEARDEQLVGSVSIQLSPL